MSGPASRTWKPPSGSRPTSSGWSWSPLPRRASPTCGPTNGIIAWPSCGGGPASSPRASASLTPRRWPPPRPNWSGRAAPCTGAARTRRAPAGSVSSSPSTTRSATGWSWSASRRAWPGRWRSRGRPGSPRSGTRGWRPQPTTTARGSAHPAYRFWGARSNAGVSDWLGAGACLLRIDPVHHKLAVFQGDGPGLCHMNFQVATLDDIFRNWHFLVDHGVEIEMGPGRHPQSTAIFVYFLGPEGFTYEYSFGVRRIEDDAAWTPRTFDPAEIGSIDMWQGPVRRVSTQPQLRPDRIGVSAP